MFEPLTNVLDFACLIENELEVNGNLLKVKFRLILLVFIGFSEIERLAHASLKL